MTPSRQASRPPEGGRTPFDAVVLAGAASSRLGGADKATVEVGGRTLLDRALQAVSQAERVVVVGPARPLGVAVTWTEEEPRGGGPAAALAAGLRVVEAPVLVVLAVDLPFVDRAVVTALVKAVQDAEGAVVSDAAGRDQPLAGAYRTATLRARFGDLGVIEGAAMRRLITGMSLHRLVSDRAAADCDTWREVARARRALGGP